MSVGCRSHPIPCIGHQPDPRVIWPVGAARSGSQFELEAVMRLRGRLLALVSQARVA